MPESKGHLNPGSSEVSFDRFELGPRTAEVVRHVWVVRWAVPDGEVRPQRVLTYPALNAATEPERAGLYGPDSRVQIQELRGTSRAVGILFRPAAGPLLASDPMALVGSSTPLPAAPLDPVRRIMGQVVYDRGPLVRAAGPVPRRPDSEVTDRVPPAAARGHHLVLRARHRPVHPRRRARLHRLLPFLPPVPARPRRIAASDP
jgi:hypothetical protein